MDIGIGGGESAIGGLGGGLGGMERGLGTPQVDDPNEPKTITICRQLNGFVVVVGCRNVVFESQEKMLKEIGRYLDDPQKVEKEYLEKK